jgi:hypothetical protein
VKAEHRAVLDGALLQRQIAGQQVSIPADHPMCRLVVAGTAGGARRAATDVYELSYETRDRDVAREGDFATSALTLDGHEESLRAHGYTP